MPITRDAAFPERAAQLMAMLNQCCESHSVDEVLQAVTNLEAAAINVYAAAHQMGDKERVLFRESTIAILRDVADRNWNRKPEPTDVPVKSQ